MKMIEGLVSIITPCYNSEKYLPETIESVIAQTYPNWEMIIINDGSKDKSVEVAEKYIKKDDRIQLVSQKNTGSAAARNNGIKRCRGQYIALLDSDDVWLPDFLKHQIDFMKKKKAYCVCCSSTCIDRDSNPIPGIDICKDVITLKDMERTNYIGCLTGLYDTSKYGKVYLHEELKSIRDDYAYWYDIVKLCGKAYGNDEILAKYRVISSSTTGNKKKLIKKHYSFYRIYLKQNTYFALIHTAFWGIRGLIKYNKKR